MVLGSSGHSLGPEVSGMDIPLSWGLLGIGAELNDFAVFTTFGLASALLLGVDGPLNGFLAIIYVLATSFRLCFCPTGE